jgi:glycine cleavage system H lipoate-binding protein
MICPFLQETCVRSCRAAGIRKPIIGNGTPAKDERCSSSKFHECPAFIQAMSDAKIAMVSGDKCPLLDEQEVRYCSAASIPHYVPWSEQAGQCGGSGHQYCELWLSITRPVVPGHGVPGHASHDPTVNGIAVPRDLWYSPNHLWLQNDEGACHIGIDGFLARILSKVDRISFVTTTGVHQPSVVLTVCGVDWALVFPNKLMITSVNTYLRHAPERLIADPYGAGWLFEAWPVPSGKPEGSGVLSGLINGEQAHPWIKSEIDRITDFVHHLDPATMNDGGTPADDFIRHLSRDEVLRLFHTFFASHAVWGGTT